MAIRLDYLNARAQAKSLAWRNDFCERGGYTRRMAAPRHDWYLKEWLRYYGKKQADMVRDLDWNKARVSLTANGKQAYDREDVNEASAYLNLQPYELLMHPDDAMALRRLRRDVARLANIATPDDSLDSGKELKKVSLG
jgi:hypothetical protein